MSRYKPCTTPYTKTIINDIRRQLESTRKDQWTIDVLDICHLIGMIDKLTKENEELRAVQKQDRDSANWWRNRYKAQVNICKMYHTDGKINDRNNEKVTRSSRHFRQY